MTLYSAACRNFANCNLCNHSSLVLGNNAGGFRQDVDASHGTYFQNASGCCPKRLIDRLTAVSTEWASVIQRSSFWTPKLHVTENVCSSACCWHKEMLKVNVERTELDQIRVALGLFRLKPTTRTCCTLAPGPRQATLNNS